jgi:septum formation protein
MEKIILASQSPRRKELLQLAVIDFEVIVSDTDESYPLGLNYEETAIYIAKQKATAVALNNKNRTILAADTIVICNDIILGKPKDRTDAINILTAISNNTHQVITAVCVLNNGQEHCFADVTTVTFHVLTQAQIEFYVDTYKPYDKAGAYAIQEWIGAVGIKKIDGDFYNVMGLPISRVVALLATFL